MNSRQINLDPSRLFKGQAGLVVRKILGSPCHKWSGRTLALELGMSQAWVNRVLAYLLKEQLILRSQQGRSSVTEIKNTQDLLNQWIHYYHINHNHFYFYLKENPLKELQKTSLRENFNYALTGFEAANQIKKIVHNVPPMIYVWPKNNDPQSFKDVLTKLENVYDFIPVKKKANLIILKPVQKQAVFFESRIIKDIPVVSPVQLFLDLYGLSRGKFIIEQLSEYWKKNNIDYEF